MTTPEKIRRRERGIVVGIVLTMLLVLGSSYLDSRSRHEADLRAQARDKAQTAQFQKCITDQLGSLSDYLQSRADLVNVRFDIIDSVIFKVSGAKTQGDVAAALQQYRDDRKTNNHDRKTVQLPPFPTGVCVP